MVERRENEHLFCMKTYIAYILYFIEPGHFNMTNSLNSRVFMLVFYRTAILWNVLNCGPAKDLSERSCKTLTHLISHFALTHLRKQFKLRCQILLTWLLRAAATGFFICQGAKDFRASFKVSENKVSLVLAGFRKLHAGMNGMGTLELPHPHPPHFKPIRLIFGTGRV